MPDVKGDPASARLISASANRQLAELERVMDSGEDEIFILKTDEIG